MLKHHARSIPFEIEIDRATIILAERPKSDVIGEFGYLPQLEKYWYAEYMVEAFYILDKQNPLKQWKLKSNTLIATCVDDSLVEAF